MNRLLILILSTGIFNLAIAEVCTQITDDEQRLACFDETHACAAIGSDRGRLECFDSAYSQSGSSSILVGDDSVPVVATPAASSEEVSEKSALYARDEDIEATIVEVTTNALKIDYVSLDNGQVWRETEDSRARFKVGQKVGIQEGIFGSHNLTIEGSSKIVKVTRVK